VGKSLQRSPIGLGKLINHFWRHRIRRPDWAACLPPEIAEKWRRRPIEEMRQHMERFGGEPTLQAEHRALAKREAAERDEARRMTMLMWMIGIAVALATRAGVSILIAAHVIG
jgi:hypothetical protein